MLLQFLRFCRIVRGLTLATKLKVTVKANARQTAVILRPDGSYLVAVNVAPADNLANEAVIDALAEFLKTRKSSLSIQLGHHFKEKVILWSSDDRD